MPGGRWSTKKFSDLVSQNQCSAFICGMGRLNYKHIIAVAHVKLYKSEGISRVL